MYGRTSDTFEHRGETFFWSLSQNRFIYNVYRGTPATGLERIGGVPTSQVRYRHDRRGLAALLPICDEWCDAHGVVAEIEDAVVSLLAVVSLPATAREPRLAVKSSPRKARTAKQRALSKRREE